MTEAEEMSEAAQQLAGSTATGDNKPFAAQLSNVYLSILALFCFKLFVKISLNLLTYFYIIRGNRKEAARISAEFYDYTQQRGSWTDRSPLHDAASQGRLLALRTLIAQGHNVNSVTIDHVTPLHEACLGDHAPCTRALVDAGADVNALTVDGATPLLNACAVGSAACTEVLLENGARAQSLAHQPSPIHEATRRGHCACVDVLLTWGADVDMDTPHLGTPLYTACVCQELECARKLLREGANVQKGRSLDSPLHAAAEKDCTAIVKLLLDFGADINARDGECRRPVDVAPPSSFTEGLLLLYEAMPRMLIQLCRQCIRAYIGRDRLHLLCHLPLPGRIRNFLQYQ
ncbi:ankyrin repeat and SOCS box protein 5 isoform X2 [Syngnathus scovelli]|uniref:ankyrin repeat and SOCS box protein 5 isoform X2 n=1 Tax=Syngnathus scovelli TaxID=161590 RepID=UPI002110298D|nr:ankyrin repeat and SOCS box protein 5 isoform X2 [Syngnathus scovelli]